jgi:hypothetical protein
LPEFLQVSVLGCRIRGTRWPRDGECAEKFNRMHVLAEIQLAEDVGRRTALQLAHKNRAPATSMRALGGVFWERSGHRRCIPGRLIGGCPASLRKDRSHGKPRERTGGLVSQQ